MSNDDEKEKKTTRHLIKWVELKVCGGKKSVDEIILIKSKKKKRKSQSVLSSDSD